MPKDQTNQPSMTDAFKAFWLRDHFDLTTSAASIAWQSWKTARSDVELRIQQLMARLADLLDEDQFAHCENIVRQAGIAPPALFQGGLSNDELTAAFKSKLPNVEPTGRDLSMFALGIEVGVMRGRRDSIIARMPEPEDERD